MLDVANIRVLQTGNETLEQTLQRLIQQERQEVNAIDSRLSHIPALRVAIATLENEYAITHNSYKKFRNRVAAEILALGALGTVPIYFLGPLGLAIALPAWFIGPLIVLASPEGEGYGNCKRSVRHFAGDLSIAKTNLAELCSKESEWNYRRANLCARFAQLTETYTALSESRPSHLVDIDYAPLTRNLHTRFTIGVKNTGQFPVGPLIVSLEGQVSGKTKGTLNTFVSPNERAEVPLSVKPTEAGEMDWRIKITYLDVLGRGCISHHPFWVNVASSEHAPRIVVGGDLISGGQKISVGGDYMPGGQKTEVGGNVTIKRVFKPTIADIKDSVINRGRIG